jgi:hypothetical protein
MYYMALDLKKSIYKYIKSKYIYVNTLSNDLSFVIHRCIIHLINDLYGFRSMYV